MKLDKNLETQESVCLEYAGSETKLLRKELILQHQVSPPHPYTHTHFSQKVYLEKYALSVHHDQSRCSL